MRPYTPAQAALFLLAMMIGLFVIRFLEGRLTFKAVFVWGLIFAVCAVFAIMARLVFQM
jgi:hypothetical protein